MKQSGTQDLKQYWFPGVHADVGGGYPVKEGDLWKAPFEWIVHAAAQEGLRIQKDELEKLIEAKIDPMPFPERLHKSLTWQWIPAEFVPKYDRTSLCRLRCNLFRSRVVESGSFIHRTAFRKDYTPRNLPLSLLQAQLVKDADGAVYTCV